jgi:hypothetical protein
VGRHKTQGLVGGDWLSALHVRLNCSVGQGRQWPVVRLDKVDVVKVSDADLEYPFVVQFGTALLKPCAVCGSRVGLSPARLWT